MIPFSLHNHSIHPCMGKFDKTNPENPCKYSLMALLDRTAKGEDFSQDSIFPIGNPQRLSFSGLLMEKPCSLLSQSQ